MAAGADTVAAAAVAAGTTVAGGGGGGGGEAEAKGAAGAEGLGLELPAGGGEEPCTLGLKECPPRRVSPWLGKRRRGGGDGDFILEMEI